MNRILQLQQDRAAHLTAAQVIRTKAETENRLLTAEERSAFEAEEKAIADINATLDIEQRASGMVGKQNGNGRVEVRDLSAERPFGPEARDGETAKERKERLSIGLGEQLMAIRNAALSPHSVDVRLLELQKRAPAGASEMVPSDGGFLVAPEFSSEILVTAHDTSLVYNLTRKIPLSDTTNALKIPGIDETSRADGSRWGGVQMHWQGEAAALSASKPKFKLIELITKKLTGLYYATDELLADARALGSIVQQAFGEEMGFKLDDACIRGNGAGQPLGILNAACLVSVAKETGQAATTIVYENVLNMRLRMYARSRPKAVWFVNQDCEAQLYSMSLKVGTAGAPVYLPPGGAAADPYSRLFGAPVIPIEQCDTVGTKGDIIYADFSQYVTVDKGDMQSAVSMHVRFLTDEQTFRWIYRVDGQPIWKSALTPFKGSNTLSPFVVLDTRS